MCLSRGQQAPGLFLVRHGWAVLIGGRRLHSIGPSSDSTGGSDGLLDAVLQEPGSAGQGPSVGVGVGGRRGRGLGDPAVDEAEAELEEHAAPEQEEDEQGGGHPVARAPGHQQEEERRDDGHEAGQDGGPDPHRRQSGAQEQKAAPGKLEDGHGARNETSLSWVSHGRGVSPFRASQMGHRHSRSPFQNHRP